MNEIIEYLKENYYKKSPAHLIPDDAMLITALTLHRDKLIVVRDAKKIVGVAWFVTLTDATYNQLGMIEINNEDNLRMMFTENGQNIHFILLAANSLSVILEGLRLIKICNAKSVSWWNPSATKLHKYNLKRRNVCLG